MGGDTEMLFQPSPAAKPALQRQLDADQSRYSRLLQDETDAAFDPSEVQTFSMNGLYGELPQTSSSPIKLHIKT